MDVPLKRITLVRLERWRTSIKQWNAVLGLRRITSEFGDKLLESPLHFRYDQFSNAVCYERG